MNRHISKLLSSTQKLEQELPVTLETTQRGTHTVACVGSWRKYTSTIEKTSHTTTCSEKWIAENELLWKALNHLFKQSFPDLWKKYDEVVAPLKIGAWTTCAINFRIDSMITHTDPADFREGFCFVIAFGDFTGGDLYFPDLNITIPMKPVTKATGERYSIVLFSNQDCFFPCL